MGGIQSYLLHHHLLHTPYLFSCGDGIFSFFNCPTNTEIEDDPAELLVSSAEYSILDKFQNPRKDSAVSSCVGSGSTTPESQSRISSIPQFRVGCSDATLSTKMGHLFQSKQLSCPHQVVPDSYNGQTLSSSIGIEANGLNTISEDMCPCLTHSGTSSPLELGGTPSYGSSYGFQGTAVMAFSNFGSSSASNISDPQSRASSGLIMSEWGQRDDNTFLGDVTGISSSDVSTASSFRDNERRNAMLFCDALSRSSRGYHDSRNFVVSNDESNNLRHQEWLNNLRSDFFGEGVGGTLRSYENGTQGNINNQWYSISEILGSTSCSLDDNAPKTTCLTDIHPRGSCSCESILRGESSGSRSSISRVVMLAGALFEVLDEIHGQPLSGPSPVVLALAEESVLKSLPMKNYKKPEESVCSDDAPKCYICLAEYEDGDSIRLLPCQHEYHTSCIDKWLKEIHSVCPLCRVDVREGFKESFIMRETMVNY